MAYGDVGPINVNRSPGGPKDFSNERSRPYVIAEAGVNHNGSLDTAKRLIDVAHDAGADAVKFQLFNLKEQIANTARTAPYQERETGFKLMIDMASMYDLPWDAHALLADHCKHVGIDYLASCFDPMSLEYYATLKPKYLKLASSEINNLALVQSAARSKLPILLSTGMCSRSEIVSAVEEIESIGGEIASLLHCVSLYPTPIRELNLRAIEWLRDTFGYPAGLSDHTRSLVTGAMAVAIGATTIEKHFTLDRTSKGPDHSMSCSPSELKTYVENIREADQALGIRRRKVPSAEILTRDAARRSVVASSTLQAGHVLRSEDLAIKRPGTGLGPDLLPHLIGFQLKKPVKEDEQISFDDFR